MKKGGRRGNRIEDIKKGGRRGNRIGDRKKRGEGRGWEKVQQGRGGGVCLKYVRIIPLKNWANNIKILQQKQQIIKQFDISRQFLNRRKRQYWKKKPIFTRKQTNHPTWRNGDFFYFLRGVILRVRFVRNAVTIKLTSLFREWCT